MLTSTSCQWCRAERESATDKKRASSVILHWIAKCEPTSISSRHNCEAELANCNLSLEWLGHALNGSPNSDGSHKSWNGSGTVIDWSTNQKCSITDYLSTEGRPPVNACIFIFIYARLTFCSCDPHNPTTLTYMNEPAAPEANFRLVWRPPYLPYRFRRHWTWPSYSEDVPAYQNVVSILSQTFKTRQHRKALWHNDCFSHNLLWRLTLTHDFDKNVAKECKNEKHKTNLEQRTQWTKTETETWGVPNLH